MIIAIAPDRVDDRQLGSEGTFGFWASNEGAQCLQWVFDRVVHGRGFVAAMRHAIGTFRVVACAETIPVCFFNQSLKRWRITFVH